jgi:ABC-2 type transport system permease protein
MEYLLGYFIKLTGFFTFCMFLGILVKRSAFALGFLFIWWILESIIYGLLTWRLFRDSDYIADNIMQFFPLSP